MTYPKQSSLPKDFHYSIYCPEGEKNKQIVLLSNPVKGKKLEKYIKPGMNFQSLSKGIPEIQGVFEFDRAFGPDCR